MLRRTSTPAKIFCPVEHTDDKVELQNRQRNATKCRRTIDRRARGAGANLGTSAFKTKKLWLEDVGEIWEEPRKLAARGNEELKNECEVSLGAVLPLTRR